jgi:hypothetical protein
MSENSSSTPNAAELDWSEKIGKPAYEIIAEMVAALRCDYERLQQLRDERDNYEPAPIGVGDPAAHTATWAEANHHDAEELADLEAAAGDCSDRDAAEQRIQEGALSVEVRSGWTTPGEEMEAEEFKILLSTGGPAVQIAGDLNDHGEPSRARLEVQDWFKPWTEYVPADQGVLLAYARCFYFGE